MTSTPHGRPTRLGVVDIGSTTATLALYRSGPGGYIDRFEQVGAPLMLMRALGASRAFPKEAFDRTIAAMVSFAREARGHGVTQIIGVATSAVRDARNGEELLAAIRAGSGIPVTLLDGESEGRAAARSAFDTLPVTDGLVVDLGGGSLQLIHLVDRRVVEVVSLPLGSARVSDAFLRSDPPTGAEVTALRRHVEGHFDALPWNREAKLLVGIGGTIRALAKVDRRSKRWPIGHGHGYALTLDEVLAQVDGMSRQRIAERAQVPGLASHRVSTIVGGAVVLAVLLRRCGLDEVLVSTYGLREGLALPVLHGPDLIPDVRSAGMSGRFPDPTGAAARAGAQAGAVFDRLAIPDGVAPFWRPILVGAVRVAHSGTDVHHVLAEPIQGYTQFDVLRMAALFGLADADVPPVVRALYTGACAGLTHRTPAAAPAPRARTVKTR